MGLQNKIIIILFLLSTISFSQSTVQTWTFVSIPDFLNVDIKLQENPSWDSTLAYTLRAIKAENPDFVLVAGDLIMGRWWRDQIQIDSLSKIYYKDWTQRMDNHGLIYYTAIGDHEIGDNPWNANGHLPLVPALKKAFVDYMKMPLNGPDNLKGTAFYFVYKNMLVISLDVFELPTLSEGGGTATVSGQQLQWVEQTLQEHDSVNYVIVMGHTPILAPVRAWSSSGLMLKDAENSEIWKLMKQYKVDFYFAGEVHDMTTWGKNEGIWQVAHGGLFGYNTAVNYLVGRVTSDYIYLEMKQIYVENSGNRLLQVGNNRPYEFVNIPPTHKQNGFRTIGTLTLTNGSTKITQERSGIFRQENNLSYSGSNRNFQVQLGCMDKFANNYDSTANQEAQRGSITPVNCSYDVAISGCTNILAWNFNRKASLDDGSCQFITTSIESESVNQGLIHIKHKEQKIYVIASKLNANNYLLLDLKGNKILSNPIKKPIDKKLLNPGVYFLKIENSEIFPIMVY